VTDDYRVSFVNLLLGWDGLEGLIYTEALKALCQPLGADFVIPPGESWNDMELE
jgi:hypothetical protein